jgi:iron(III) transport system substrate-binding protein
MWAYVTSVHRVNTRVLPLIVAVTPLALAACGGDDDSILTVYSGRDEELVGPLLDRFEADTGIEIEDFYDKSEAVALKLDEEGDASPADVFLSQSPGPLGFLDIRDRFRELPAGLLDEVEPEYRAADGQWIGVSGRVRVLAYNPDAVDPADLPRSVLDLVDPAWNGRVGVAPTNSSFQDFVSFMRIELGDDATSSWLEGLADNGARTYSGNSGIVDAIDRGEVDVGLVNHYYVYEIGAQNPDLAVANHFFDGDDVGSLVMVSGVAILDTAGDEALARRFVEYLLSESAQEYLSTTTYELPLAGDVPPPADLPSVDDLDGATADLERLGASFGTTADLIEAAGLTS